MLVTTTFPVRSLSYRICLLNISFLSPSMIFFPFPSFSEGPFFSIVSNFIHLSSVVMCDIMYRVLEQVNGAFYPCPKTFVELTTRNMY